jgi:hypothetical protein
LGSGLGLGLGFGGNGKFAIYFYLFLLVPPAFPADMNQPTPISGGLTVRALCEIYESAMCDTFYVSAVHGLGVRYTYNEDVTAKSE